MVDILCFLLFIVAAIWKQRSKNLFGKQCYPSGKLSLAAFILVLLNGKFMTVTNKSTWHSSFPRQRCCSKVCQEGENGKNCAQHFAFVLDNRYGSSWPFRLKLTDAISGFSPSFFAPKIGACVGLGVKGLRLASVIAGLRCDVERECDRCRESPRESEVTLCICVCVYGKTNSWWFGCREMHGM